MTATAPRSGGVPGGSAPRAADSATAADRNAADPGPTGGGNTRDRDGTGPRQAPPVSIIGIGCRVPGAAGVAQLWQLLIEGHDATRPPPPGRTGHRRGGYLDRPDAFDNDWFAISEREAAVMDPQQRLGLEVAVEAIDDAGIGYRLRGSQAAVVFGACGYEHGAVVLGRGGQDAPYAVTGSALSIIANRLSYVLDLHGPSLVLDSACSSSLAAVDLAVRLLADGTVPLAIVGGVNLTLLPHTSDYLEQGGFLAPDGRCKPFDAAADGYTRGDGCTVLVLQRTADALREGNRIYAEIVGAAVGSDGRSNGLHAPNGRSQQQVIRSAWTRAGVAPGTAGFFECHGTGTALGDAVEVGALAAVLASGGDPAGKIWIGSVKSNVGHLEAAAGVTGLAKAALCIRYGIIAPTIHFHRENPLLKLEERGLRVPTEPIGWHGVPASDRYAGISSFGFGGTNAHVVLRGSSEPMPGRDVDPPVLIPLTGRDEAELRDLAGHRAATLAGTARPLREFGSAAARLLPESARAAVLAWDSADAEAHLDALARPPDDATNRGEHHEHSSGPPLSPDSRPVRPDRPAPDADRRGRVIGPATTRRRGGVLFLFSGQGGQHPRMGRALAARYPVFARAVATAADALAAAGGPRVWTPRHGFGAGLGPTDVVQPAIFAYQVAAAELLGSWGIRPDAVTGHSLGEIAGAVASGALGLTEAARVVVARSRTLARLDGLGAMALLEATPEEAWRLVEPMRAEVGIAAINGPRSVVVSGTPRYVEILLRRARRRRLFALRIAVDFAAHSPQVRAVLPDLRAQLDGLEARVPRLPFYSTSRRGAVITGAVLTADYWADNAGATVELAAALETAAAEGMSTVVELSPHPVLTTAIREYPDFRDATHPMATRDDEAATFLECMARLFVEGRSVDWSAHGPFLGPAGERRWRKSSFPLLLDAAPAPVADDLDDHVVQGVPTVPAVYWLRQLLGLAAGKSTRIVDFAVHERTDRAAVTDVTYRAGADLLEVIGPVPLASARPGGHPAPADIVAWMRAVDAHHGAHHGLRPVDVDTFYATLRRHHLDYGPRFRPLRRITAGNLSAIGLFGHAPVDTATLDGCLQLIAAAAAGLLPPHVLPLPVGMASAWLSDTPALLLAEAHAFVRDIQSTGLTCDVIATDQHGAPAVALLGVRIRYAEPPARAGGHGGTQVASPHTAPRPEPTPARPATDPVAANRGDTPLPPGGGTAGHPIPPPVPRSWLPAATPQPIAGLDSGGHRDGGATPLVLRRESWEPVSITAGPVDAPIRRVLVVGESELAVALTRALARLVPAERVAREPVEAGPIVSSALTGQQKRTAVVVVWPGDTGPVVAEVGRALDLLQRVLDYDAMAALTVVLRDQASLAQNGVAGLVRSLQLESGRSIRLVWAAGDRPGAIPELVLNPAGPEEVRVDGHAVAARRFRPAAPSEAPVEIRTEGSYVVTGGLGALGTVAVRWLLDAGARDVVVLTRTPRPLPPLLEGLEDRIVLVRCDVADRTDLANALDDIRECGSTIRGLVHAAGALRDAEFGAVTPGVLAAMFEPKPVAAADLLDLTAADPLDFTLLFSSATGALGAPGQAAYAAANAALDALAAGRPARRVLSIGWGSWAAGLADAAGGAAHLRRAGIVPFDAARGTAVLSAVLGYPDPVLLALDYAPTADGSPTATRLRSLLSTATTPPPVSPPAPQPHRSTAHTIRSALAVTLGRPPETLDPDADFTALGLSSLLAIELRRNLESRFGVRIATAELFEYPTVAALAAALTARIQAAHDRDTQAAHGRDTQAAHGRDTQAAHGRDTQAARDRDTQAARDREETP
jgi:acyl transferase domain-containing protein/acyl carrier protein